MQPSTERLQQIAAIYAHHDAALRQLVQRRGSPDPMNVEDACAYAWAQLVEADHVDLRPPLWRALAWMTTVAIHEAWRLNRIDRRNWLVEPDVLESVTVALDHIVADAHDFVEQQLRLDLVAQIPERPRRFLLRLALGYSYDEISVAEGVSFSTTNRQIARAKRILRELDRAAATGGESPAAKA